VELVGRHQGTEFGIEELPEHRGLGARAELVNDEQTRRNGANRRKSASKRAKINFKMEKNNVTTAYHGERKALLTTVTALQELDLRTLLQGKLASIRRCNKRG
jgi:hypothetical protein